MPFKAVVDDFIKFVKKHKYEILGLIFFIVIIIVVILLLNRNKSSSSEYYYNNLDKSTILSILSKNCNLSLRDYVNILNSTNNLRTLFLQQICNNNVCPGYNPQNEMDLLRIIKSISADCILKCIKSNDIYRLALVNLKINDIITSIPHSFTHNYPIFQRTLTNEVYGVESVNVYIKIYKDGKMSSEQKSVKDIVNLYIEKLPKIQQTDQEISSLINQNSLDQKDATLYISLVKDFINKISSPISQRLLENKDNNSKEFSIELFDIISTVTLLDIFLLPSLGC